MTKTRKKPHYPLVVQLARSMHAGHRGDDVEALKRALHHAGVYPGNPKKFTHTYGESTTRAVKAYQRQYNRRHPKAKRKLAVTGVYNEATHRMLVRARNYDQYGAWLMSQHSTPGTPSDLQIQRKLVSCALFLISNAWRIHYSQEIEGPHRRMSIVRDKMKIPFDMHEMWEDCSGGVTGLYWNVGLPDPNGRGYDGYGYTGTLVTHGQHVSLSPGAWKIGDLLIYGPSLSDTHHVTMLISNGGSCFSHGQEAGPLNVPWNYRSDLIAVRRYF